MFKKGSGKKNLVGLDIGSSSVKAVELGKKGAALQLLALGFENLQTDTIVDGQIMELNNVSNVIAQIFNDHQIRTTRVAAGVSGHSVIVKNIVLPQMSQEELQESFSWHAEEHIPFDIADVNLDYELTGKSQDALHVLMAACKSDKIANVKQAIQLAGKQPVIIDVDAFALQNCYEVNYRPRPGEIVAIPDHRSEIRGTGIEGDVVLGQRQVMGLLGRADREASAGECGDHGDTAPHEHGGPRGGPAGVRFIVAPGRRRDAYPEDDTPHRRQQGHVRERLPLIHRRDTQQVAEDTHQTHAAHQ